MSTKPLEKTYTHLTAANILTHFGFDINTRAINRIFADKEAFGNQLLSMYAHHLYTDSLLAQAKEHQDRTQATLTNIMTHYPMGDDDGPKSEYRERFDALRQQYLGLKRALGQAKKDATAGNDAIEELCQTYSDEWQDLLSNLANQVGTFLSDEGYDLSEDFQERFCRNLLIHGTHRQEPMPFMDALRATLQEEVSDVDAS
jgi:AcrR family transcriptional regulator